MALAHGGVVGGYVHAAGRQAVAGFLHQGAQGHWLHPVIAEEEAAVLGFFITIDIVAVAGGGGLGGRRRAVGAGLGGEADGGQVGVLVDDGYGHGGRGRQGGGPGSG